MSRFSNAQVAKGKIDAIEWTRTHQKKIKKNYKFTKAKGHCYPRHWRAPKPSLTRNKPLLCHKLNMAQIEARSHNYKGEETKTSRFGAP